MGPEIEGAKGIGIAILKKILYNEKIREKGASNMKLYTTTHLVKSEDLNHHGTLFGARAADWFVEAGLVAVAKEHGKLDEIVMRNILDMSFKKPVEKGTMLDFESRIAYVGTTSLVASIVAKNAVSGEAYIEGYITYVTVESGMGGKKAHGLVLDDTQDSEELEQRRVAAAMLQSRVR